MKLSQIRDLKEEVEEQKKALDTKKDLFGRDGDDNSHLLNVLNKTDKTEKEKFTIFDFNKEYLHSQLQPFYDRVKSKHDWDECVADVSMHLEDIMEHEMDAKFHQNLLDALKDHSVDHLVDHPEDEDSSPTVKADFRLVGITGPDNFVALLTDEFLEIGEDSKCSDEDAKELAEFLEVEYGDVQCEDERFCTEDDKEDDKED